MPETVERRQRERETERLIVLLATNNSYWSHYSIVVLLVVSLASNSQIQSKNKTKIMTTQQQHQQPLQAALSPDESLTAVVVPSSVPSNRRMVQIYQTAIGTAAAPMLQTTLTTTASKSNSSTTSNVMNENITLLHIQFAGPNHVVALGKSSGFNALTTPRIFIWDLTRGGVVAHTLENDDKQTLLDVQTYGNFVYLLVALETQSRRKSSPKKKKKKSKQEEDDDDEPSTLIIQERKLQIHKYDPASGKLLRKIKCGKSNAIPNALLSKATTTSPGDDLKRGDILDVDSELGLAIFSKSSTSTTTTTDDDAGLCFCVRNALEQEAFRIIDAATGEKLGKYKYPRGKGDTKDESDSDDSSSSSDDDDEDDDDKGLQPTIKSGGQGIVMISEKLVAIPRMTRVDLFSLVTKKWIPSIPATSATSMYPHVQAFPTASLDEDADETTIEGTVVFMVDTKLFQYVPSASKVQAFAKVHCEYPVALVPRHQHLALAVVYNASRSVAGNNSYLSASSFQFQSTDCHVSVDHDDEDSDEDESLPRSISIQWMTDEAMEDNDENNVTETGTTNKRKAIPESSIKVLGAGQKGQESATVSELSARKKKKKKGHEKDDDDEEKDFADKMDLDAPTAEEDGLMGMSIAERLKAMTDILDRESDDDEEDYSDEDDSQNGEGKRVKAAAKDSSFVPKQATTESLSQLLTQALQGGDDGLLELALTVRDKNILQETIKGLDSHCIDVLLAKLTSRLASKPQRAETLATWLSFVLQSGRVRTISQLQPLKNLLQERIEAFPHLLRLEGRLAMIKTGADKAALTST